MWKGILMTKIVMLRIPQWNLQSALHRAQAWDGGCFAGLLSAISVSLFWLSCFFFGSKLGERNNSSESAVRGVPNRLDDRHRRSRSESLSCGFCIYKACILGLERFWGVQVLGSQCWRNQEHRATRRRRPGTPWFPSPDKTFPAVWKSRMLSLSWVPAPLRIAIQHARGGATG